MCAQKVVICMVGANGVLYPNPSGQVVVQLVRTPGENGEPDSGTIGWGGKVQAFVTFSIGSNTIAGINCTDLTITAPITELSINNILPHMCN